MKNTRTLNVVVVLLTIVCATSAVAQDWQPECKATSCTMSRELTDEASGNRIATVSFAVDTASPTVITSFAVPLGVALEPGIKLKWQDKSTVVKFRTCYPDGCQAAAMLEHEQIEEMAEAKKISISFFPVNSDRPILAEVPLTGLDQAVDSALKSLQ